MRNLFVLCIAFLWMATETLAQVGINADNSTPDSSAGLDVNFNNKGFLPPRVALIAINSAIPVTAPAIGLLVYNTAIAGTPPNNVMPGYYCWNGTKWIPVLVPRGTNPGDMLFWNGTQWVNIPAGSNGQVLTFNNGVPAWVTLCGRPMTINHIAGTVAPVNKTVTYGTVTNIPGETSKCWITSNLGADQQATAVNDPSEASAGWYFQFNRKQGYRHDGITRTPDSPWITSISESLDWQTANDPCTLELGAGWRIPTSAELTNADESGNWNDWTGPWDSALKMHASGYLYYSGGFLSGCGSAGAYWSSTQNDVSGGYYLDFGNSISSMSVNNKAFGFTIRCIRDF